MQSIQNIDLRLNIILHPCETYTLGILQKFQKSYRNGHIGTGNEFSFENALGAINYDLNWKLKIARNTYRLKNFSLNLNASYIL
jgi:hypothetical protein